MNMAIVLCMNGGNAERIDIFIPHFAMGDCTFRGSAVLWVVRR